MAGLSKNKILGGITRPRSHSFAINGHVRRLSTQPVTDSHIHELASRPLHRLTLSDLVRHGKPPLTTQSLLNSANFTLSILPSRLAQRINALRNLPFIVLTNPHLAKIHSNYVHSLSTLLPWAEKEICTPEDEQRFALLMADLVQTHAETIPTLARGFLEARRYISPAEVTKFLDEHLRARIGTRLIAEQHLALHHAREREDESPHEEGWNSYIGVIDTKLNPARVIRQCEENVGNICDFKYGTRPRVVISGEEEYAFAQIPVHLEYIITELLKNAFRATIENRMEREPVEVTVAPLPDSSSTLDTGSGHRSSSKDSEMASTETDSQSSKTTTIGPLENSTPGVTIRLRDRGGGIAPDVYDKIWNYSFTTFDEDQISSALLSPAPGDDGAGANIMDGLSAIVNAGGSSLAGLGYGLPLGRAYAEYFGGGIAVQSLWGWGTDVYLSLRGVGRVDL